eukprot:CAMPEP_0115056812 /NCGR_PEP_ID=MMETSP0227-20121206/5405_1 /TAXON_ID=89957 /ORGANISM="Polarella glacialis, Strain CCMP 1383" /LENGTH=202 /DNA_ID=CAMNT_0002441535 /DNA_START=101 /DNA_END=709 /DNA_ORIENTATION=+
MNNGFDCFVVLDFEATCADGKQIKPQEIIEFPLVVVDALDGRVVGEFRTYVRPVHHPILTAFCQQLTGIQQSSVDEAPTWPGALALAQAWLQEKLAECGFRNFVFVTCGDWDLLKMIVQQCATSREHVPESFRRWVNIKNVFQTTLSKKGRGMVGMLKDLGLPLEGRHHSGLDDSRNIAKILAELLRRGASVDEELLSHSAS